MTKPQRLTDVEAAATELASEISDIVRADAFVRRERWQASDSEAAVENASSLICRISSAMLNEIDRAISELQSMQDVVRCESERVEREITNYASMGQTTMASIKILADGLAHWRSARPQVSDPAGGELAEASAARDGRQALTARPAQSEAAEVAGGMSARPL